MIKKIVLSFLLLMSTTIGYSQLGFTENIITDESISTLGPKNIISMDLDADGDLDIVSTFSQEGKVVWFENLDGQGSFSAQKLIANDLNSIIDIHILDFDEDGDFDIMVINDTPTLDGMYLYENLDGLGSFSSSQVFNTNLGIYQIIASGDVDGDADLDIVLSTQNTVYWFENLGSGIYGIPQSLVNNIQNLPIYIELVDFDGNGTKDLFVGSQSICRWYSNTDGLGDYNLAQSISIPNEGTSISATVKGYDINDLNGDGDVDIIGVTYESDTLFWLQNIDGLGTFSQQIVIDDDIEEGNYVRTSDIDSDGDLDIIAASDYSGGEVVFTYENIDGTGNFAPRVGYEFNSSVRGCMLFDIADFNSDGNLDIIAGGVNFGLGVMSSINSTSFFSQFERIDYFVFTPSDAIFVDIDGDNLMDVLAAGSPMVWYKNLDGNGTLSLSKIITGNADDLDVGDIDNDGDMDILESSNKITWSENANGLGEFSNPVLIDEGFLFVNRSRLYDIDNDGDLDILSMVRELASNGGANKIIWYENLDGFGTFSEEIIIITFGTGGFVHNLEMVDLNNDGFDDILPSKYDSWFEHLDGQGTFSEAQSVGTSSNAYNSSFDIDDDGDNDVISARQTDIVLFRNIDGNGTFSDAINLTQIDSGNGIADLKIVDLDSDGDKDIAVGYYPGRVEWYENIDGMGNFSSSLLITENLNNMRTINFADLNGNGNIDVVTSSIADHKVSWFENTGAISNQIYGTVRYNANQPNCNNGTLLQNINVNSTNGNNEVSTFTLQNGYFVLYPPSSGSYETELTFQFPEYFDVTPESHISTFSGLGNMDSIDFCIEPNMNVDDLVVSIYNLTNIRPGFETRFNIVVNNVGSTNISPQLEFTFDGDKLNFVQANQPVSSQTGNAVRFDFVELAPFQSQSVTLELLANTPPINEIDDELTFTAEVTPSVNDETPMNNIEETTITVVGSFDPNDINVAEGPEIFIDQVDEYLHYTIRFQNTGNAAATFVIIENQLDDTLNWGTIQLEGMSHTGNIQVVDGLARFVFNNINLPPEIQNPAGSNGYLTYKIKPIDTFGLGDSVANNASIFFDYNAPIFTNTVTTTVVEPLGITSDSFNSVKIYPIPVSNKLRLESAIPLISATIYNQLGQIIYELQNEENIQSINMEHFNQGLYYLKVKNIQGDILFKTIIKN